MYAHIHNNNRININNCVVMPLPVPYFVRSGFRIISSCPAPRSLGTSITLLSVLALVVTRGCPQGKRRKLLNRQFGTRKPDRAALVMMITSDLDL